MCVELVEEARQQEVVVVAGHTRYRLADTDALRLTSPDDQVRIEGSGTIYRLEIRSL